MNPNSMMSSVMRYTPGTSGTNTQGRMATDAGSVRDPAMIRNSTTVVGVSAQMNRAAVPVMNGMVEPKRWLGW